MPNRFLLASLKGGFRVIKYLDRRQRREFNPADIKSILIVNTTAIGDTLLSTPPIRAIRLRFPDARITVLASSAAKAVLLNNPHIDEIIDHPGRVNFFYIFKLPGLLKNIRRGRFDMVIILHANDPDIAPLSYLSGAPHRMGWAESELAFLHTIPVRTKIEGMHSIDIYLKNLKNIGVKAAERNIEFYLSYDERKWADRFIQESGLKDKYFIGIHPFGSKVNRWWAADNVIRFCNIVEERFGWKVVVFGGNKEVTFAEDIATRSRSKIIVTAGRLSIRESAALIKRCLLFVSTDSGPMHLSQALRVPTIALFGPVNPTSTGPITEPYEIIQKILPCTPCNSKTCDKGMECMRLITPEDVLESIDNLLGKVKGL